MLDVIVVGGGPGGLHTATGLARRGFEVCVVEEHPAVGRPVHCTGVLASEAFDEFRLSRDAVLNPLRTVRLLAPSGRALTHTTADVEAIVIDRVVFDQWLLAEARAAGVRVELGVKVRGVTRKPNGVVVHAAGREPVQARACVLACGASYALQRNLGLGIPAIHLQSAQIEVPSQAFEAVEVHFGRDVAPNGFAWVVPVRRADRTFARIGLMCERDASIYFARFLSAVQERLGIVRGESKRHVTSPRQKLLPLAPIARTYADRVVAVGDAAGLVKATTGGGIYYSLVSGTLAAEVLGEALRRDDLVSSALAGYEGRWRGRLGAELRAQLALRTLAHRLDDVDIDAFFDLAGTNGIMPIVRRTARFNQHRALISSLLKYPPARRVLFRRLRRWEKPRREATSAARHGRASSTAS